MTAQFIRTRRPEVVAKTGNALANCVYALVLQYGGGSEDYEKFPVLDAEWDLIAAALPPLLQGDNGRLQTVCDQLTFFLEFTGRWDDWLWFSTEAEARALAADDKEDAGWRAYQAGTAHNRRKQPSKVLACAARAAEHWKEATPRQKAIAIRLRGIGHEMGEDYPSAIIAYREALEIDHSISPESKDVATGLNDLASAENFNGDYDAAERDIREALRIARILKDDESTAIFTANLAVLALDRELWTEVEALARESLALSEKVGRQELIAADCRRIAQALLKQNRNLEEALALSHRAIEIYRRLKSPQLEWTQEILAEIEKAIIQKGNK